MISDCGTTHLKDTCQPIFGPWFNPLSSMQLRRLTHQRFLFGAKCSLWLTRACRSWQALLVSRGRKVRCHAKVRFAHVVPPIPVIYLLPHMHPKPSPWSRDRFNAAAARFGERVGGLRRNVNEQSSRNELGGVTSSYCNQPRRSARPLQGLSAAHGAQRKFLLALCRSVAAKLSICGVSWGCFRGMTGIL